MIPRPLFLAALLALIAPAARAVDDSCFSKTMSDALGGQGNPGLFGLDDGFGMNVKFEDYESARSILVLSDGWQSHHFSVAEKLAERFPGKKIVATELDYHWADDALTSVTKGNFTRLEMDNTKPFPFAFNSFDRIVLRQALCVCDGGNACAGFGAMSERAAAFFEQVVRALNKRNPDARAYLHGENKVTPQIAAHWKRIFGRLEKTYGVRVTFHYTPEGRFNSITIRPGRP